VNCVKGMRDYEQNLQTELALRTQLTATPPGKPGPDPQAAVAAVSAIVERYPELKANSSFKDLRNTLVETEQRIALARGYFNEIALVFIWIYEAPRVGLEPTTNRLTGALRIRPKPPKVLVVIGF